MRVTDTGNRCRRKENIPSRTSADLGTHVFQSSEMEWIFLVLCKVFLSFKDPKMCPTGTGPDSHDSVFRTTLLGAGLKLARASFHDDKLLQEASQSHLEETQVIIYIHSLIRQRAPITCQAPS